MLVSDRKLDRFCQKQKKSLKQNKLAYHLGLVLQPSGGDSPFVQRQERCSKGCCALAFTAWALLKILLNGQNIGQRYNRISDGINWKKLMLEPIIDQKFRCRSI